MSKPLVPLSVAAPGFLGLNTQESGGVLPVGWATKLSNFVYDNLGRLASRQGSRQLHASAIANTPDIAAAFEYVDGTGNVVNIIAGDNKIFKEDGGTVTDVSGAITTPTGDNWQFQNFNTWCVGYQEGHEPILLDTTSGTFVDAADFGGAATKTMYNGSMVLSAFGRTWTIVNNTLYYSDLLIHSYAGGSSGSYNLSSYWPNGMDEGVAIANFNGYLVVFGKQSIIVYQDPDDVSNMSIVEGIDGTGCIARDSVQSIGKDLVFLSSSGLKSLGRVVDQKSMPLIDISRHVRDSLIGYAVSETSVEIKSAYSSEDGFYLLSFPASGITYVFDLKFPNEDGTWKVSTWDIAPTALLYTQGLRLLMGVTAGYLSRYQDYLDGNDNSGTGGSTYSIDYEGSWNDFGEEVSSYLKILKNVSVLASGVFTTDVVFKWSTDYSDVFHNYALVFNQAIPAQYGIAQYDIDTYAAIGGFERVKGSLSSLGQVVKTGIFSTINGQKFALQRIDVLAKIGRLGI